MKEKLGIYGEWGWRLICTALLVVNIYLKGNYVSLDDYKRDRDKSDKAIAELTTIIATMQERDKVNDRQDEMIKDHELRIRLLESRIK